MPIRAAIDIPVIANGEIWTVEDALRCRAVSGCDALMLGRGAVADPGLALAIAAHGHDGTGGATAVLAWPALLPLLREFWALVAVHVALPRHRAGRIKQWLHYLRRRYPEAELAYAAVRTLDDPHVLSHRLFGDREITA